MPRFQIQVHSTLFLLWPCVTCIRSVHACFTKAVLPELPVYPGVITALSKWRPMNVSKTSWHWQHSIPSGLCTVKGPAHVTPVSLPPYSLTRLVYFAFTISYRQQTWALQLSAVHNSPISLVHCPHDTPEKNCHSYLYALIATFALLSVVS